MDPPCRNNRWGLCLGLGSTHSAQKSGFAPLSLASMPSGLDEPQLRRIENVHGGFSIPALVW